MVQCGGRETEAESQSSKAVAPHRVLITGLLGEPHLPREQKSASSSPYFKPRVMPLSVEETKLLSRVQERKTLFDQIELIMITARGATTMYPSQHYHSPVRKASIDTNNRLIA